jgi:hypothetical protein
VHANLGLCFNLGFLDSGLIDVRMMEGMLSLLADTHRLSQFGTLTLPLNSFLEL